MIKPKKRRVLHVFSVLALLLTMLSGGNPTTVRADGHVEYNMYWWGDCWYWDAQLGQEIGAAQYYYDNWRHVASDSTVRYFEPLVIYYSGVCSSDTTGSQYSLDGWRMDVNTPYDVKVYNQANQQVYP